MSNNEVKHAIEDSMARWYGNYSDLKTPISEAVLKAIGPYLKSAALAGSDWSTSNYHTARYPIKVTFSPFAVPSPT